MFGNVMIFVDLEIAISTIHNTILLKYKQNLYIWTLKHHGHLIQVQYSNYWSVCEEEI